MDVERSSPICSHHTNNSCYIIILGEFSNNDIIQDLNRLLALQSGESSSNQSELFN